MYVLRFPLRPIYAILPFSSPIFHTIDNRKIEFRHHDPFLIAIVRNFNTQNDAIIYAQKIWSACKWALVKHNINSNISLDFDKPVFRIAIDKSHSELAKTHFSKQSEPLRIMQTTSDGPVIYDENILVNLAPYIQLHGTLSMECDFIVNAIVDGLKLKNAHKIPENQRLKLALDLYSECNETSSIANSLITLCTILEVLSPERVRPDYVREYLDRWAKQIKYHMDSIDSECEEYREFKSLYDCLNFTQDRSKQSGIRLLVIETFGADDKVTLKKAINAYGARSTLVHKGSLAPEKLHEAFEDAQRIVAKILQRKMEMM